MQQHAPADEITREVNASVSVILEGMIIMPQCQMGLVATIFNCEEKATYDAKLINYGTGWAYLCDTHYKKYGCNFYFTRLDKIPVKDQDLKGKDNGYL